MNTFVIISTPQITILLNLLLYICIVNRLEHGGCITDCRSLTGSTHGRLILLWLLHQPPILFAVERMITLEVIIERACGMDVHKDSITACIMTPQGKEIQTFSTKTVFLLQLIDWINDHGCTHVAMESTGVFWKPQLNQSRMRMD